MPVDLYRRRIAATVVELAREDPFLVKEVITRLRTAGEIETDDLVYLDRIADRWIAVAEAKRTRVKRAGSEVPFAFAMAKAILSSSSGRSPASVPAHRASAWPRSSCVRVPSTSSPSLRNSSISVGVNRSEWPARSMCGLSKACGMPA